MDTSGESYYSGGRFFKAIQEVDQYSPTYGDYIEERRKAGQSTSRRDYFRDPKEWVGHTSLKMTSKYMHFSDEDRKAEIARLATGKG